MDFGNLRSDGIGDVQLLRDMSEGGGGWLRSSPIGCCILPHGRLEAAAAAAAAAAPDEGHRCSGTGRRASVGGANGEAPLANAAAACRSADEEDVEVGGPACELHMWWSLALLIMVAAMKVDALLLPSWSISEKKRNGDLRKCCCSRSMISIGSLRGGQNKRKTE